MQVTSTTYQLLSSDLTLNEVLQIDGTLELDPRTNVTLTTTKNIVVTGKLISQPNSDVIHTIRFVNVNESKFVGGGDTVLENDIGLWVTGAGQLDLQGSQTDGWNPGGDVVQNIDMIIQRVSTLKRNVCIEGTATGQSHIFIKSSKPQSIRYVQLRYMGPRRDRNGDGVKELVTGRYAVHFHHSEDGSRGSIIEGCIAKDCGNHCYVAHGSHGITFRGNIALNVVETPFWYDLGHKTNDLLFDSNLVANVMYVPRALDQDSDDAPNFGAGGFLLGFGEGNICRNNVVYGTSGDEREGGAYIWPEIRNDADQTLQLESPWTFENNTAISCPAGISVWQNNLHHHIVQNTTIINCPVAIMHGAYGNHYRYIGGRIVGGHVEIFAASATTNRIRFEGISIDAADGDYCVIMKEGPLLKDNPPAGTAPVLLLGCKLSNYKKKAILNQNPGPGWKDVDVINCGLPASEYMIASNALSGEFIRVQEQGKAWKITKSGTTQIAQFAPTLWGTGNGLKAEYFTLIIEKNSFGEDIAKFGDLKLSRVEPNVNIFDITHPQIHYAVPAAFAARWTGKIQPQFSETYTLYITAGGGVRMWIDGYLWLNKWAERYPGETSFKKQFKAGQLYDLKLEYFNQDDRSQCLLEWSSPSLKREFIQMSQLYSDGITPPPPPTNQPPTADAGVDQVIEVSTMLYGTGKNPEGGLLTYKWEQTKGVPAVIVTPAAATTKVTGLTPGENVFKLTVTDDKEASGVDEVSVMVR